MEMTADGGLKSRTGPPCAEHSGVVYRYRAQTVADVDDFLSDRAHASWADVRVFRCRCRRAVIILCAACERAIATIGPALPGERPICCHSWEDGSEVISEEDARAGLMPRALFGA